MNHTEFIRHLKMVLEIIIQKVFGHRLLQVVRVFMLSNPQNFLQDLHLNQTIINGTHIYMIGMPIIEKITTPA